MDIYVYGLLQSPALSAQVTAFGGQSRDSDCSRGHGRPSGSSISISELRRVALEGCTVGTSVTCSIYFTVTLIIGVAWKILEKNCSWVKYVLYIPKLYSFFI